MFSLRRFTKLLLLLEVITFFTLPSFADNIVLDFEGLKNNEQVKDFYNGGTGSEGSSSGKNYGISFSAPTLAIIDSDAGGSGNFANEPSPNTTIYFLSDNKVIMNVKNGFSGGFSFWYTSIDSSGSVEVWTGENGTGKLITSMELEPLGSDPDGGDPTGKYNKWKKVSVSFDGEAHSVVFKGVANKIGFDNIALSPYSGEDIIKQDLNIGTISPATNKEPGWVRHGVSQRADTFETVFNVYPKTDEQEKFVENFCSKTRSFIIDKNDTVVAKQLTSYAGCTFKKDENQIILRFRIQRNKSGGLWFENGHLEICDSKVKTWDKSKRKTGECYVVRSLPEFSIYGTEFNLGKDGFSFENGNWNKATNVAVPTPGILIGIKNTIAKIGDVIATYLKPRGQEIFWMDVGYENTYIPSNNSSNNSSNNVLVGAGAVYYSYDPIIDFKTYKQPSLGLCYGMALSSVANFNWRNSPDAWGIRQSFNQEEWRKDVESHWNKELLHANPPYRPFNKNTHDYAPNFQAMEKIMYYFVAQPFFYQFTNDISSWVGRDLSIQGFDEVIRKAKDILKQGYITELGWDDRKVDGTKGGHSVTLVGLIEIGDEKKFVIYDNNYPYTLWDLPLRKKDLNDGKIDFLYRAYSDGSEEDVNYGDIILIDTLQEEPLYSLPSEARAIQTPLKSQKDNTYIPYPFQNHIKIYVVGGTLTNIKLTNGKDVLLYPLSAELKKGVAYKGEFNSFKNILLLPADKKYKVTVKKSGTFPFLKVFATIPYDNGTVEYVVYDHAEISENGTTYATFTVGRNNNDKNMYREDSTTRVVSSFAPTFVKTYKTILPSPSRLEGIIFQDEVKLLWKNPQHPNFKKVVVVRKENEIPTSTDNGTEVYRGSDETVTDIPPDMNKVYCYSVFAIGKDGDISEPNSVCIDTYKYTLYGHVTDENGNPVSKVLVKLYNKDKSKLINMTSTGDKGLFVFNGLLDGSYVLTFEHPFYTFNDNEMSVTLQNGSREVEVKATGKPAIFMDVPQEVEANNKQLIIWDGVHVKPDETVTIKLFFGNDWYTIANKLPFDKHSYEWNVSIPEKVVRADNNNATAETATLRVELDGDPSVYAEKEIVIIRTPENVPSNENSTTTQQPENTTNETSSSPHSKDSDSAGCSIASQTSIANGIFNLSLMLSGLFTFIILRRKDH